MSSSSTRREKPLSGLAPEERSAWREEARGHRIDSIAEKEAMGLSREAAVETALAEFGEARRISQAVARVKDPPADRLVRALFGGLLGLLGIGIPLLALGAGNFLSFLPHALIAQFFLGCLGLGAALGAASRAAFARLAPVLGAAIAGEMSGIGMALLLDRWQGLWSPDAPDLRWCHLDAVALNAVLGALVGALIGARRGRAAQACGGIAAAVAVTSVLAPLTWGMETANWEGTQRSLTIPFFLGAPMLLVGSLLWLRRIPVRTAALWGLGGALTAYLCHLDLGGLLRLWTSHPLSPETPANTVRGVLQSATWGAACGASLALARRGAEAAARRLRTFLDRRRPDRVTPA